MSELAPPGPGREEKTDASPAGNHAHVLQFILNSMDDGVTVIDENARFVLRNQAAERIAGVSPQHVSPVDWCRERDICLPGGAAPFPEDQLPILRALRGESMDSVELFVRHPDAPEGKWLSVTSRPFTDEQGKLKGAIAIYRDITERRRYRAALMQSQQRFTAFMRHLPGVAFMKNREGQYIFYNEAAQGLFQLDPEDFLGKTDHEVWPAEYAERFVSNDREVIRTKKLVESVDPVPHKHAVHHWLIYRFPILDENEDVQFIGGVGIDITERRQLEDQLRQSQKMEAIGRLAGGVAHDFNNLLTVISGYGHMIVRDLPQEDPLHGCVEEVLKAASRATSLTNQLLAFSRRQVIQPKVLDLNALVANMDRMLRRVIGEHIELETVLSPGLGSVKADAGQIEQVIMNLAVNARDAMPEGGKLSIRTRNVDVRRSSRVHADVRPGCYVRLTMADTGNGMDAEIMIHLFEPFYTSKETGKGTGLGLSTVYGIVKQSGGEIVVESEPGHGAIFNIYLPRITDISQLAPPTAGEQTVRAGTETILLVEDEVGVRQLVHEMLRRLGYKIHEASGGADAVRIFQQHKNTIDLLLTDVIMPQMSGRDLAGRLKALQPSLKVLYISGYTDDMLAHHGVLESNVYLLQKPFAPDELAKKLREVLDAPATRGADA